MLHVTFHSQDLTGLTGLMKRFMAETASAPAITGDVQITVYDIPANAGAPNAAAAEVTTVEVVVEADKKKRGPKAKDPAPAAPATPVQTDIEEVTAAPHTYDEVVNALKNYMTMPADAPRGMTGVIKLLKDNFQVEQTKALKPEQYAEAIKLATA